MKSNDMNILLDRQRSTRCYKYAAKIQGVVRGVVYRIKYCSDRIEKLNARREQAAADEAKRLEALSERAKFASSAVVIQSCCRMHLVKKAMRI